MAIHISRIPPLPPLPLLLSPPPPFSTFLSLSLSLRRKSFQLSHTCLSVRRVYLGFFTGVPNKGESVESHLFDVANATEHFFVVRYKRKKENTLILRLIIR